MGNPNGPPPPPGHNISQRGVAGVVGRGGEDGLAGLAGKPGTINIMVVQPGGKVDRYGGIYNFAVTSLSGLISDSGFIEPGQSLSISNLCIRNTGHMPTVTGVEIFLNGNTYIVVSNDVIAHWTLETEIRPGNVFELPRSKMFSIASGLTSPQLKEPLQIDTNFDFYAIVPRTLRCYKNLCQQIPIHIQYPVEISLLQGSTVCVPGEMVPFTVVLRNLGRVALGLKARAPRTLFVRIEVNQGPISKALYVRVGQREGGSGPHVLQPLKFSLEAPVNLEIDYLAPESELVLAGAIGLSNVADSAWLYDRVTYRACLCLGPMDSPLAPICIQQDEHSFQVGEYFVPPSLASKEVSSTGELVGDFKTCLLVVHNYTSKEEIAYWKEIFARAGLGVRVFNISIHMGLSYFHGLFRLNDYFQLNCVVILNSPFYRDDNAAYFPCNKLLYYPMQYMAVHEIFVAARHYGVRTYVVNTVQSNGQPSMFAANFGKYLKPMYSFPTSEADKKASTFDGRNRLYAYLHGQEKKARDEMVPAKNIYCRIKLFRAFASPDKDDFQLRIHEMSTGLNETRPDRQYFL
jgi:hypothetical protein